MTEEQVTKFILNWLIQRNWHIICFDFPQSGTGKRLRRNDSVREKNKDDIIPDIVCIKDGICLFFENKNHFSKADFIKQNKIKNSGDYDKSIKNLLNGFAVTEIQYGIGLPLDKYSKQAKAASQLVDFVFTVSESEGCFNYF